MALSTSNSNPGWKSYTETNDENDIIRASDFDNEFSIKVDQDSGYSLNQNLVACSIDNTSTLRGLKSNLNVNDLVNFYLNYNPTTGAWTPACKVTSTLQAATTYTSSGTYILTNNILYYWGQVNITDVGVVSGIVSNGTMDFIEYYSTSNVAANGITSTEGTGSGATFNITSKNVYKVSNTLLNAVGQDYSVNDVLTIPNAATIVVTSVTVAGTIVDENYTLNTTPQTTDMAGNNISSTGGTGTGAEFTVASSTSTLYTPASITLNGAGSGYAVNDTITLVNIGTVTVTGIGSNGEVTSVTSVLSNVEQTTDMSGTAVSGQTSGSGTNATFTVTSKSGIYYTPNGVTMTSSGTGYTDGDTLTISYTGGTIATVYIKSVTVEGQIQSTKITNNTDYQASDVSGNNIVATGGTGNSATFNVTTNQYYTYDKAVINNGGQNYIVGDVIKVQSYGSYTVTNVSASDGSVVISGLPYEPVSNTPFNVDVSYFDGSTNTLIMGIENTNINLYSDQKNTVLSTSMLQSSFTVNFSGWFPINNS